MANEADQLLLKAQANRLLKEVEVNRTSHPQLAEELNKLYGNLSYRPTANVRLSVSERAAFALMVETYANPIREVQLKRADILSKRGMTVDDLEMCAIDANDVLCPQSDRNNLKRIQDANEQQQ